MSDASSFEQVTIDGPGMTVSRLIWKRFQTSMPGLAEQVFDLNPSLANAGTYIPIGTIVLIPIPSEGESDTVEQITLWS